MQAFAGVVGGPRLNMELDVGSGGMFARAEKPGRGACRHSQRTRPEQQVFQREFDSLPNLRHVGVERRNAAFEHGSNLEMVLQVLSHAAQVGHRLQVEALKHVGVADA